MREDVGALQQQLRYLRREHRELDETIASLGQDPTTNQLQLRRMKKRKLLLKDAITRLESRLIPDLDA
jgi:hypothetical protein